MKTESKVAYDDRRKVMTHIINTEEEAKDKKGKVTGTVTTVMTGVYKEEGIKTIYRNLRQDVTQLEQGLKKIKDELEKLKEFEEDDEVKKLRVTLDKIDKLKKKEQLENQKEEYEERIKFSKKSLSDIKEAIGTRLKF